MGLTIGSVGAHAVDSGLHIEKHTPQDRVVALAGNPNVGKSTVFNGLTGLRQHTGNWPGKTVTNAQGFCESNRHSFVMVDIPGTYSLLAHSVEEEIARNFVCFGAPDAVVVVCDATCLSRNLNLALQVLEITSNVVICVNLMDEATRKGIRIDLPALSARLGVPVVGTVAQKQQSLDALLSAIDIVVDAPPRSGKPLTVYPDILEEAIALVESVLREKLKIRLNSRWLALRLLDRDQSLTAEISAHLGDALLSDETLCMALAQAQALLRKHDVQADRLQDMIVSTLVLAAEDICRDAVRYTKTAHDTTDRRIDRILTSRLIGYPAMLALLALVLWLTIAGANYPSTWLANALFQVQDRLTDVFLSLGAPDWLHGALVLGVYRTLAWVVSVMLPPMAIFFPLFTLLEDVGYLPRIAYNLDKPFQRCKACGKQALTMWVVDNGMRIR